MMTDQKNRNPYVEHYMVQFNYIISYFHYRLIYKMSENSAKCRSQFPRACSVQNHNKYLMSSDAKAVNPYFKKAGTSNFGHDP